MRDAAGMGRVRVVFGLLALAGVAAIVVAVAAGGGDGKHPKVPEGGSAFGARPRAAAERDRHLLDALAPLLAPAPRSRGVGRRLRAAGSNPSRLGMPAGAAAARLFMVGFDGTRPRASFFQRLRSRGWGGVVLERDNYVEPGQLATLAGEIVVVARNAGHAAPLVAAPQTGGEGTAFPNLPPRPQPLATTAGAARNQAELAGQQLQALGIHMTFAPSADLAAAGGPWEARAFGDDPGVVTAAVRAAVNGYRRAGVASAVGHFPGEGGASQDPAEGTATVGLSLDELRARDVRPFAAVARRAPAIQLSSALYAAWDGVTPATLLPEAIALLREDLGFRGVVVSGDLAAAMLASGEDPGTTALAALRAGCDLLWLPGDAAAQEQAWQAVVRAIRSGALDNARIARSLARIARLRRSVGLDS